MLAKLVLASRHLVESHVISLVAGGAIGEDLRAHGISLVELDMPRGRPTLRGLQRFISAVHRSPPDVIQTWLYHADLLGCFACCVSPHSKLIWNLRCSNFDSAEVSITTKALRRFLCWLSRLPAVVISNSHRGVQEHLRLGYRPRRWEVIENGFDTEKFRPDRGRRLEFRERLKIAADTKVVAMVARLDPMKDHHGLLKSIQILKAQQPNAVFYLVGRGIKSLREATQNLGISEMVILEDERSDVETIYAGADYGILSSAYGEGCPNTVGEAMACGVPVVASAVGGLVESIVNNITGILVAPENGQAIAAALIKLNSDPQLCAAMGAAGRARAIQIYSVVAMASATEEMYVRALAPSESRKGKK